ncbi:G-protein beta subunit-like protein (contains WD40 repeats) [Plasmopara halstedii]|uniref:Target of rapamycin complex subunit LST8 n=1 Tax=Plasmopara halstedii TaxID=4781 RepID=A0A0P1B201_PLAHL|nr:G-protein beta subunit-like protein (contains WD40 repeats) [Plasmopara halstedii]CEG47596.1 G-protein beta subunit-like protein (contains WD40 repeats) [Plasmopara halstedii]|eukprot:XP_024583965.1 G-protein beta subunit-like protein (contains WD40 repeats) [Plasmopara halstedii]
MAGVVLATAGYDHTIRFWEAASGTCNRTVKYPDSQVNCLQITPDKKYIAAAGNPHIRLFEINSNNPNHVTSYDGHATNVTSLGFQRHGKWIFSCSDDGSVKIWDLRAPGCQRSYDAGVPLNSVVLHPNQAELIVGDQNGVVRVYDLTANALVTKLEPPTGETGESSIRSVDIVQDGSALVAANNHGKCFFYRPKPERHFELHGSIQAHNGYILKARISANGKFLATCSSDKTAKVWSLPTAMAASADSDVAEPETHSNGSMSSQRPMKSFSMSSTFGSITPPVPSNTGLIHTLQGHQRWVWDCAFSAVSSYLVTCSSDQSARLWDLSQGEAIRQYSGHHKAVICVALNDSVAD